MPKITFGAWCANFQDDFVTLQRNWTAFHSISLFYYGIGETGTIWGASRCREHLGMIDWAHRHGIQVYATIGGTPPILPGAMEGAKGDKCIADLVRACETSGFDGVDIDFEGINNKGRATYTDFITRLNAALKKMKPPRLVRCTVQDFPNAEEEASMAFDYAALSKVADFVCVMHYDYSTDKPGPINQREWFGETVAYARSRIPAAKYIAALPWYGRDWIKEGEEYEHVDPMDRELEVLTGTAGFKEIIAKYGVKPRWDDENGEFTFTYTRDGKLHEVWMPEHRQFSWMVDEIKKVGASGIYVWHAAYPDLESFKVLEKKLGTRPTPRPGKDLLFEKLASGEVSFSYTTSGNVVSLGNGSFNASSANELSFEARLPAEARFHVELEEGTGRGGDGEVFTSRETNGAGDWYDYTFALGALQPSETRGNLKGNKKLNQRDIKSWSLRVKQGQAAGTAAIRNVRFSLVWGKESRKTPR